MTTVLDAWEQTPKEWFSRIVPVHMEAVQVPVEVLPFKSAKISLPGTSYTYQLALADIDSDTIAEWRAARPNLPMSGDRRTGVLVFDGPKLIASYIVPGETRSALRRLAVHEDYRGACLAKKMMIQWIKQIPLVIPANSGPQPVNIAAVKTWLRAIHEVVDWAVASGKVVPQRVKDAWIAGTEEAEILATLALAESGKSRA